MAAANDLADPPDTITVDAALSVPGARLQFRITVPTGPTRSTELLPILQGVAEGLTNVAVQKAERDGLAISCKKGCGACCRQIVPLSETEAYDIHNLVRDLPEPRRSEILARFAAARKRLEEAGLLEVLLAPERAAPEQIEALILDYFRLGIACPFLEEESCSIHPDRPVQCREYLVTSPPENCARLSRETVRPISIPASVAEALRHFDTGGKTPNHWVPLVLALEWAEAHPDGPSPRPGTDLLRDVFSALTGQEIPAPPE